MSRKKADKIPLIVTLVTSVIMMIASIFVLIHIIYTHGLSYGDVHDRFGNVIGRIRYVYGGLALAFFGISFCAIIFSKSWKKLNYKNSRKK